MSIYAAYVQTRNGMKTYHIPAKDEDAAFDSAQKHGRVRLLYRLCGVKHK